MQLTCKLLAILPDRERFPGVLKTPCGKCPTGNRILQHMKGICPPTATLESTGLGSGTNLCMEGQKASQGSTSPLLPRHAQAITECCHFSPWSSVKLGSLLSFNHLLEVEFVGFLDLVTSSYLVRAKCGIHVWI